MLHLVLIGHQHISIFFSNVKQMSFTVKKYGKLWDKNSQKCPVCSVMSAFHLQNGDKIIFQSQPEISAEAENWTKLLDVP